MHAHTAVRVSLGARGEVVCWSALSTFVCAIVVNLPWNRRIFTQPYRLASTHITSVIHTSTLTSIHLYTHLHIHLYIDLCIHLYIHACTHRRYGRVMLMTDQDHDGSHIKGLFINFLHFFWPSLLQSNVFLEEFVTAVVKATRTRPRTVTGAGDADDDAVSCTGKGKGKGKEKGKGTKRKEVLSFYTIPEYNKWMSSLTSKEKQQWKIKYYKGLGTNTSQVPAPAPATLPACMSACLHVCMSACLHVCVSACGWVKAWVKAWLMV